MLVPVVSKTVEAMEATNWRLIVNVAVDTLVVNRVIRDCIKKLNSCEIVVIVTAEEDESQTILVGVVAKSCSAGSRAFRHDSI